MKQLIIILLILPQILFSEVYYVDKNNSNSNDNNPGSEAQPFKTIIKGLSVLTAGDTLYVKEGIYKEYKQSAIESYIKGLEFTKSGTPDKPIVISAYPGDAVIIDQQYEAMGFHLNNLENVVISGFEIRNLNNPGIWVTGNSKNILLENNHIYNLDTGAGNNIGGIYLHGTTDSTIRFNLIHDVHVAGDNQNGNASGVHSYDMGNVTIINNTFYNVKNGVIHKRSPGEGGGIKVLNNYFFDLWTGVHFTIAGEGDPAHYNNLIEDNVFFNVKENIYMAQRGTSSVSKGLKILNNTFIAGSNTWSGITIGNVEDVSIKNNIFYGSFNNGNFVTNFQPVTITEFNYNVYNTEPFIRLNIYDNSEPLKEFRSLSSWQEAGNDINSKVMNVEFKTFNQDQNTIYDVNNFRLRQDIYLSGNNKRIGAFSTPASNIGYFKIQPKPSNPDQ
jgi:hypothetical protein